MSCFHLRYNFAIHPVLDNGAPNQVSFFFYFLSVMSHKWYVVLFVTMLHCGIICCHPFGNLFLYLEVRSAVFVMLIHTV